MMNGAFISALFSALLFTTATIAQEASPTTIVVFPFELEDRSAGAGIIEPDEQDLRYLEESELKARDMLAGSGHFNIVATPDPEEYAAAAPHGIRNCSGCEGKFAKQHGASLALLGVVTRVNRTEHTMFIRIIDSTTGATVAQGFTDLRMGANYAWPRSVKWVMERKILPSKG